MSVSDRNTIDLAIPNLPSPQGDEDLDLRLNRALQKKEENAFHIVKLGAIYLISSLAGLYLVIFFLNLFLPEHWRWLGHQDLLDLRGIAISILSGVVTSLAINFIYKNK